MLTGTITTHIIAVYAPTEVSADDAKDNFYTKLQDTVDTIPKKDLILLAGDFNAHVGASRTGWEMTLGNFGRGDTNNNGLHLLSFATANGLLIGNSLFQHPCKHQITWRAPNGKDTILDTMDKVDEEEQQISNAINACATKLCPNVRQRTQTWISDSSLDLIDQRKQAKLVNFTWYRELSLEICQQLKAE
uniref:Endonuclease/exonuclease/phosphatase domain-containing protein n=1 Tax=Plectus sambesii TaxID=2011161 RepID=A0A914WDQ7_9BILA